MKSVNNEKEKSMTNKISHKVNKHFSVLFVIAFLIVLIFGYMCNKNYTNRISNNKISSTCSNSNNTSKSKYSKAEIITIAKYHVKNKLKSPSSAKFCPQNEITINYLSDSIIIAGYVDAENGFGAKVRTTFRVTLTEDGSSLKSIYMN